MSSNSTAGTRLSAVSNPEILGRIEYPQYRTRKYCEHSQYMLPKYLSTPVPPHESNMFQLALVGSSVKGFCQKKG